MEQNELHKEMKGVYDYIENTRSENNKVFSALSQDIAALNVQVTNTVATVKDLADTVKAQSKFPVGTVLTGIGLVITIVVVLAAGFIGQPLAELKSSHVLLMQNFSEHEQLTAGVNAAQEIELNYISRDLNETRKEQNSRARWIGQTDERLEHESTDRYLNDDINKERIVALEKIIDHQRETIESGTANRYDKNDAKTHLEALIRRIERLEDKKVNGQY